MPLTRCFRQFKYLKKKRLLWPEIFFSRLTLSSQPLWMPSTSQMKSEPSCLTSICQRLLRKMLKIILMKLAFLPDPTGNCWHQPWHLGEGSISVEHCGHFGQAYLCFPLAGKYLCRKYILGKCLGFVKRARDLSNWLVHYTGICFDWCGNLPGSWGQPTRIHLHGLHQQGVIRMSLSLN